MTTCAQTLVSAVGGIAAGAGKIAGGVAGKDPQGIVDGASGVTTAITDALMKMIGAFGTWLTKVLGTNDKLHIGISNIATKAEALVVPVPEAY